MSSDKVQITEHIQGAVQAPDGEIQYYTKTINNKHNPYLQRSLLDKDNGIEYKEIECNGQRILITTLDLEQALKLEYRALIIKLLCIIDLVGNLLIIFNYYYSNVYRILVSIISLSGFIATTTYNKYGLILYLIYQYLQTISKIIILGFYIIATIVPQVLIDLNKKGFSITFPIHANIGIF